PEEPNPEEPTPPTPVTPEEPNPPTPEADAKKQKLNKVVTNLKSGKNKNVITYETEDGEPRAVIWTMGINAPRMSDFRKDTTTPGHIIYSVGSQKGSRWFDVNKSKFVDSQSEFERSMCFAAVSANQLHWWLDQNAEYIQAYIAYKESQGYSFEKENPILNLKNHLNSYESQEKSGLYDMFKVYFGNKSTGFYTDLLNDFFINGYKPNASGGVNLPWKFERDYNGGFFYDVFGETQLTKRWGAGVYQDFKRDAIYLLKQGDVVGIVHESPTQGISHIVTMWGLEVDCDGEITALYISDSDDQYEPEVAMRKMFINRRRDAYARLTTNVQDANAGAKIIELSPLSLGTEQWEQYIQNIRE
ncbi:MAG: IdeS/Mac family cysteine endopeptidase, partial [Roseburia sp.]